MNLRLEERKRGNKERQKAEEREKRYNNGQRVKVNVKQGRVVLSEYPLGRRLKYLQKFVDKEGEEEVPP
jgi:hypothetical protein